MKVYVASRFKAGDNRRAIEQLCESVRGAGMKDFSFIRDIENYEHTFDNPKELWQRSYDELGACDALLVDVSDNPSGGRMIEIGIAYALHKRIFITVRKGTHYKNVFKGVATAIIEYETHKDLTRQLKKYSDESDFSYNDKVTLLVVLLAIGGVIAWTAAQLWLPLAVVVPIIYWILVRHFFKSVRVFDRVVIYIPLILLWIGVSMPLIAVNQYAGWGFAIAFWPVTLIVLQKLKFSL